MYQFGTRSKKKLATVHLKLAVVAQRAIELSPYDFTIVHGWRNAEIQNALYESGASTKPWPESKHNALDDDDLIPESLAIDFGPWIGSRIPWKDTHIFAVIAGCFFAAAKEHGRVLRWGADWDSDGSTKDQTLLDYGHMEIIL